MKKYAYIDKARILHIVAKKEDAERYSGNKKVVKTEIEAKGGYPFIDGNEIIVYSETCIKINAKDKQSLDSAKYPMLVELYRACK